MIAVSVDAPPPMHGSVLNGTKQEHEVQHGKGYARVASLLRRFRSERQRAVTTDKNLLTGAREIARYFFGDEGRHRAIYRLWALKEPHRFPMFKLGDTLICARKSEIDRWIEERERASNDNRRDRPDAA